MASDKIITNREYYDEYITRTGVSDGVAWTKTCLSFSIYIYKDADDNITMTVEETYDDTGEGSLKTYIFPNGLVEKYTYDLESQTYKKIDNVS